MLSYRFNLVGHFAVGLQLQNLLAKKYHLLEVGQLHLRSLGHGKTLLVTVVNEGQITQEHHQVGNDRLLVLVFRE